MLQYKLDFIDKKREFHINNHILYFGLQFYTLYYILFGVYCIMPEGPH